MDRDLSIMFPKVPQGEVKKENTNPTKKTQQQQQQKYYLFRRKFELVLLMKWELLGC